MEYNKISPTALSNQNTIKGVMGEAVPNTFNRSVGLNVEQQVDPITGDLIVGQQQPGSTNDQIVTPSNGVKAQNSPIYGLNKY